MLFSAVNYFNPWEKWSFLENLTQENTVQTWCIFWFYSSNDENLQIH